MAGAIFQLDTIKDLPFWAQVFMASRAARAAAYALPADTPENVRAALVEACDVLDRCAQAGEFGKKDAAVTRRATAMRPTRGTAAAIESLRWAADAALAAHDTQSFSAADGACISSAHKAMVSAAASVGRSPLQVAISAAADMDQLRFACAEARVGRYDRLGSHVVGRMAPVYPPRALEPHTPPENDETGGAR